MNSRNKQTATDRPQRGQRSLAAGIPDRRSAAVERFVTVATAAELLAVCDKTVRRWLQTEKLASHKFGGLIRVAEGDLRAFIVRARRAGMPTLDPIRDSFYTAEHVAEALGVSLRTVRRRIDFEVLVAYDFFGLIRIAESDLRDYCDRSRRE
jgi:excisionase family DNA binding protein